MIKSIFWVGVAGTIFMLCAHTAFAVQGTHEQTREEALSDVQARAEALLQDLEASNKAPFTLIAVQADRAQVFDGVGAFRGQLNTGEVCTFTFDIPEFLGDSRFGPRVDPLPRIAIMDCPVSQFGALRQSPEGGYVVESKSFPKFRLYLE